MTVLSKEDDEKRRRVRALFVLVAAAAALSSQVRSYKRVHRESPDAVFERLRHYDETEFRRAYRVTRKRFNSILDDLGWQRKRDGTGRLQTVPSVALMSALRQLAVGISSLSMVKEFGIARPTMDKYLEKFCKDMVARYAKEYLSPDLKKVVQENKKIHKVPGLLGSLDCTHIYWGQCPTGHKGNYIDRHKRISVILEAVADAQLRFVHFFFGYPGGSNDLNVLQGSPLMEKFVDGSYPRLDYNIAGQSFDAPFILVDGI